METATFTNLKLKFQSLFDKPEFVTVENFSSEIENENKCISWETKISSDLKNFKDVISLTEPNELELLMEGFRCLCQIHINLIKDFKIFKIYPIRKYSSAYNYISKIPNFEDMIYKLGYEKNESVSQYRIKETVDGINNREEAINIALNLLLCYIEVDELIKIRYEVKCSSKDLMEQRELMINKNKKDQYLSENMSEDKILDLFKTCEFCELEMNLETGICPTCEFKVADFAFAPKLKDFIKSKFNQDVEEKSKQVDPDTNNIDGDKTKSNRWNSIEHASLADPETNHINEYKTKSNQWNCEKCTYLNSNDDIICTVCETARQII